MVRIAIVGSRSWPKPAWVKTKVCSLYQSMKHYPPTFVSGGASGVDAWAAEEAKRLNLPMEIYPAEWELYGKKAGMIRNATIVAQSDRIIAFWDGESRGTFDTIKRALKAKKNLEVIFP